MSSPIVVPSMSNTYDQSLNYMFYKQFSYQPVMHVPIHHTLENATIAYDTRIEHQKDLVKDVFFSPAMNDREMSPAPSISSGQSDDDDESSVSPSELLPLEEEDLFNLGLEILEKKPNVESNNSKRRWSDSILDQNKRQKLQEARTHTRPCFDEASDKEELEEEEAYGNTVEFQPFEEEDDTSSLASWEESEEEYKTYTKKQQQKHKKVENISYDDCNHLPKAEPRPTAQPTLYQKLTKANVDWCRYCGTTEGVNWRPGPWEIGRYFNFIAQDVSEKNLGRVISSYAVRVAPKPTIKSAALLSLAIHGWLPTSPGSVTCPAVRTVNVRESWLNCQERDCLSCVLQASLI
ncbi:hypothetical protein BY458DRAFT_439668 [Sporodiniella umbellata]|nr:hypothetical protein BY458DRAFT_439668 [Sporodiniella umbellata]